jgi:hypothetical protein
VTQRSDSPAVPVPGVEATRVVKRSQRGNRASPAVKQEPKPSLGVLERHSGEGSASALETLQKLEKRRIPRNPPEPPEDPTP